MPWNRLLKVWNNFRSFQSRILCFEVHKTIRKLSSENVPVQVYIVNYSYHFANTTFKHNIVQFGRAVFYFIFYWCQTHVQQISMKHFQFISLVNCKLKHWESIATFYHRKNHFPCSDINSYRRTIHEHHHTFYLEAGLRITTKRNLYAPCVTKKNHQWSINTTTTKNILHSSTKERKNILPKHVPESMHAGRWKQKKIVQLFVNGVVECVSLNRLNKKGQINGEIERE